MRGTILWVDVKGAVVSWDFDRAPTLRDVESLYGGRASLDVVPGFDSFMPRNRKPQPCVAFRMRGANRENFQATIWWRAAQERKGETALPEKLLGDVVILYGDDEFMDRV